jgi:hypothetical protein
MAQDVFISYSRVDLPFVEQLVAFLMDADVSVWFDQTSLLPGKQWEDVIEDEIARSRTFLVCLSKAAMAKAGYFHVEQHRASNAALRIPPVRVFVLPILLGDCELPRSFRQYHAVNLVEPGAIEMLPRSLSSALERELIADPEAVERLRNELIGHLGVEGASNQDFVNQFMQTEKISFQDLIGIIERIANSSDPKRLGILLQLRAADFLSYAGQAALDIAISNVKAGNRTKDTQATVKGDELRRIAQMGIPGNADATQLLQINKYFRYISRKDTEPYKMAEAKIRNPLAGRD